MHSHPLEKDKEGNIVTVGTPTPSKADKDGVKTGSTPDMVLGYTQIQTPAPSNTIGASGTVETIKTVGFYNSTGSIITIKMSDFIDVIKKVNKDKKN